MHWDKDIDVLVVGYAGVDRILRVDRPAACGQTAYVTNDDNHTVHYGGNGSNVAACLGRLGQHVVPLMRVGSDWQALGYQQMLLDYGVDLCAVEVVQEQTTSICHLIEDSEGNHLTMTYPGAMDARYAGREMDGSLFARANYALLTVATRPDVEQFLAKARQYGVPLVFGVRVDEESFPPELFRQALMQSEIIFMNEVERAFIERTLGLGPVTSLLERGNAKTVVVTLGERGSAVYERTPDGIAVSRIPAARCSGVVDATGAGDAYIAGFLYGVLTGKPFPVCAVYGGVASSFVIEKVGCTDGAPTEQMLLARSGLGASGAE